MTDDFDTLDRELREYGERWRATIPQAPALDVHAFGSGDPGGADRRSRLLPAVVAAAVALVVLGVSLMTGRSGDQGQPPTDQTPAPTTSAEPGLVPWAPLDASHPELPLVTTPASPDPVAAKAAPPCAGGDLRAVSGVEGAAGTVVLYLTIRPASPDVSCHLLGHPKVQFLNRGRPVDIPTVNTPDDSTYRDPALVGPGNVVTLSLYWGSNWCADPVGNDRIRVALESGSIEVDGFGRSPYCNGTPGSGPNSVSIGTFQPQEFRQAEVTSAYSGLDAKLTTLSDPMPGEELSFQVTLTARRGDVSLEPCPDYSMAQYAAAADSVKARFALNCAAVPYRSAAGVPYLPTGVPVRFEMRWRLLGPDRDAPKAVWTLEAPGGPALAIPTGSDGT